MNKMTSKEIRKAFFDFFISKDHKIEPSAPIVRKNDPTLMFTNSGMAPFKDFFLGNAKPNHPRIADTQKCLRVSGKHNDLEEVGIDSYHHTMFEMLGNWSFGDYFKKEAIEWAWELLTVIYKLPKERLYVSVFAGSEEDGLGKDEEAYDLWKQFISEDKILAFDKKDNFWEMGDTGPCGPCSEIHVDLRDDEEILKIPGKDLVNRDHPQVIEVWNLVFMQYNRLESGKLVPLPARHVDTGMGFERLCMALQGKKSNYDTDIFSGYIQFLEKKTGIKYTGSYDRSAKSDIAFRVIVDHIRAVSFAIADGQLPDNTGAGYVIRRILRRAVRYYFSFLNVKNPLLFELVEPLAIDFKDIFPGLFDQKDLVTKVILEEERSFLRTLDEGLKRIDILLKESTIEGITQTLDGKAAFELYDTFGFPIDLTRLIISENNISLDEKGFEEALQIQKNRSKKDAQKTVGDWTQILSDNAVDFLGYDHSKVENSNIVKYRTVMAKGKVIYQLVLDKTPFYGESGGQVGDTGTLTFSDGQIIKVIDTQKENDLIIHITEELPRDISGNIIAKIHSDRRKRIENNHSATHLLHSALRQILGDHVQQKGSLVNDEYLRFDFSHFQKVTDEELHRVEKLVNSKIRENIQRKKARAIGIEQAKKAGAMMLFGEKYGDTVRMITFDENYSIELCGGCHVKATGDIGMFKLVSEGAVAAGIRRIECITGETAENYLRSEISLLNEIRDIFKNPKDLTQAIVSLQDSHKQLEKLLEEIRMKQAQGLKEGLMNQTELKNGVNILVKEIEMDNGKTLKNLIYELEDQIQPAVIGFGFIQDGKPQLMLLVSKSVSENHQIDAGKIIRNAASHIRGGGGGQKVFATAGGTLVEGLREALEVMKNEINEAI